MYEICNIVQLQLYKFHSMYLNLISMAKFACCKFLSLPKNIILLELHCQRFHLILFQGVAVAQWSTGQAIDPASGACFIPKFMSLVQFVLVPVQPYNV